MQFTTKTIGYLFFAGIINLAISSAAANDEFRVTLLGTGDPIPRTDRFGPSTLVEAGIVFRKVGPKLAVYTHLVMLSGPTIPQAPLEDLISRTRKSYDAPLVIGEDLMSFIIDDEVTQE
jgi:hypothetical protein